MGLNRDGDRLRQPEKLTASHRIDGFNSGNSSLDDWLKRQALKNQNDRSGSSRTYVVCKGDVVVAYYCLAAGSVARIDATSRVKRNMPDPIPVMVIGRLAVHLDWQNKGIGRALLRDAILRTLQVAEIAGIRAILVHAISEEAKQFYEKKCGFTPSPLNPMTLMVTVSDAVAALGLEV